MLTTLDHLVIAVRDLDAATATYSRLLGRAPSWRGEHPGAGSANALFRLANTYVELLSPAGPGGLGDVLRAHLETDGEGPFAIAFGTDDAAACATALRARGLSADEPADGRGRDRSSAAERRWRTVALPPAHTRGVRVCAIEHRSPADALPPAAVVGDAAAAVSGVDHAVIMTGDPEAARVLYGDQLGLRLALDRTFADRRVRLLFFRIAGITVELAAPLGAAPEVAVRDRFWGISYRVPDADAAHVRLVAGGFDVSDVRSGHKAGTRVCSVRDAPHGVATLFIAPDRER